MPDLQGFGPMLAEGTLMTVQVALLSTLFGILIGIEGVESKDIRVENGSPENVQVTLQPDISGFGGRAFFVIRSKTARAGSYQVTFAGGCGSKTIPVTVR